MSLLAPHVLDAGATAARVTPEVLDEAIRLAFDGGPDHELPGWQSDGLCNGLPVETYFGGQGAPWRDLADGCSRCHVQSACLAFAIANGENEGVWGGTTANGRKRLRKVLREAGVLGVSGEGAYLAWVGDGADREPEPRATTTPVKITARPHQDDAVAAVCAQIRDGGACQIAMATASGKTHVGLWVAEQLDARLVLVLVPNLALVAQTARLWAADVDREQLAVCSDTGDLDLNATTAPDDVRAFAAGPGPRVIFATYQSSSVLTDARIRFDLAIADEAHHLAGDVDKHFAAIVRGDIPTDRTLYMTATPRRFRKKGGDTDIVSMDDPAFGPRVYELLLGDAITQQIVADYRVIVAAVDRDTFDRVSRHPDLADVDPHLLAGAIAVVRTMGEHQLASCISFHTRIERARTFAGLVGVVAEALPTTTPAAPGWAGFLHGGASVRIRSRLLDRLVDTRSWGVVANAKTLGEGVDVPTLDAIAIVDPKTAEADIMQAVGRALRRPGAGVSVGTVVLPVLLAADIDENDPLGSCDPRSIEVVAGVLRSLRAHDTDLGSRLDHTRTSFGRLPRQEGDIDRGFLDRRAMQRRAARGLLRSRIEIQMPGGATGELAGAIALQIIRDSTTAWEEAYGRLQQWVADHGEIPSQVTKVPTESGTFAIGAWCSSQRTDYNRGLLDPVRAARLSALPTWEWDPRTQQWWNKLHTLREYVERNGDVPSRAYQCTYRGIDLGSFVNVCRTAYQHGGKDGMWLHKFPDRIAALEAIPGWVWNTKDAQWDHSFTLLERWVEKTGAARPTDRDVIDGRNIGKWTTKQRARLRAGQLDPERAERLRSLPGWIDDYRGAPVPCQHCQTLVLSDGWGSHYRNCPGRSTTEVA